MPGCRPLVQLLRVRRGEGSARTLPGYFRSAERVTMRFCLSLVFLATAKVCPGSSLTTRRSWGEGEGEGLPGEEEEVEAVVEAAVVEVAAAEAGGAEEAGEVAAPAAHAASTT